MKCDVSIMKKIYKPKKIEAKWQKEWEKKGHPKPKGAKKKYYVLDMFPYPSGDGLHVGHVENFTATDIVSRYMRAAGHDVMHPMGWDAFGLPAENFAIKTGIHPDKKTHQNIKNFTRQLKSMGISYDWDREIDTSSPEYYKWTQWMFLFLYKNGLAYKKKAHVNWCPSCQTVLANEQVIDGKCDRCKSEVVQKDLEQWFFKITDFVEDSRGKNGKKISGLISGLKKVDWPESTKAAQVNWIGRSEGAEVIFFVSGTEEEIKVYTTRLDTIFGCTYVVLAPEHPFVASLLNDKFQISNFKNKSEVKKYLEKAKKKTDLERTELAKEKTGVKLEGVEAVNPFTAEKVPIYVADYVLGTYGTGAVMAVPAHDERDFEFAKKYQLPINEVIAPSFVLSGEGAPRSNVPTLERDTVSAVIESVDGKQVLVLQEEEQLYFPGGSVESGESPEEAIRREIKEETGYTDVIIEKIIFNNLFCFGYRSSKKRNSRSRDVFYHVRLLSEEQVENEADHGKHIVNWVNRDEVGKRVNWEHHKFVWQSLIDGTCFTDDGVLVNSGEYSGLSSAEARERMAAWLTKEKLGGKKVNYRLRDWLISRQRYWGAPIPIIYCDDCGTVPVPEKDLPVKLPTDVDFRPTGESPLVRSKSFHKVKCPKCYKKARRESDTMDTFVCSSWYYLRFADPKNSKKFADQKKLAKYLPVDFYMGGAEHTVLHLLYSRFFTKALARHGYLGFDEPFSKLRHQGMVLAEDGRKMSKSWGNVVNPDDVVNELGADTLRLYEMFMGPLEDMKAWNTGSVIGLRRFLEKVWKLRDKVTGDKKQEARDKDLEGLLHRTIKKVTADIEELKFNTAISSLMILVNAMEKEENVKADSYKALLLLLSPFAPHIAEELWHEIGNKKSIFLEKWPKWDKKKIVAETAKVAVQVNGKLRTVLVVESGSDEAAVKSLALQDEKVKAHVDGKQIRKAIYIQDKILNLVVS